ncbi:phosphotransferase [Microlunatus parietis]|uniref:Aminoglycoside phosphotransferase (APT) family kinase protein n=1 Tax=Microlunatus parietis TaxID=682979 RepID=A0A7Y9IFY1_9ACTN|nr:phosphotransferase [Microlunatus parietis]NYE75484.1 aminoglycoside phosphotransferase (APT) family kinase protein [Microlunatus parietis]
MTRAPELPAIVAGLADLGLRLVRSWPRGADRLLLDLTDHDHRPVAGQWLAAPGRAAAIAAATPGAHAVGPFVLQPAGADRRLPAVVRRLQWPGTALLGHRPERRAVLREPDGSFTKIVRPDRWRRLVDSARLAESLPLATPTVLDADPGQASVTTAALPGRTLTALLTEPAAAEACRAAGRALAGLHRLDPAIATAGRAIPALHDLTAERAVTAHWQRLAAEYAAPLPAWRPRRPALGRVPEPPERPALIHRDLHDGQLLINDDGEAGLIDFDLIAVGDPALDLANLIAHLELRADQGVLADPEPLIEAVLNGYRPSSALRSRLPGYLALARARLDAVYAFRP